MRHTLNKQQNTADNQGRKWMNNSIRPTMEIQQNNNHYLRSYTFHAYVRAIITLTAPNAAFFHQNGRHRTLRTTVLFKSMNFLASATNSSCNSGYFRPISLKQDLNSLLILGILL